MNVEIYQDATGGCAHATQSLTQLRESHQGSARATANEVGQTACYFGHSHQKGVNMCFPARNEQPLIGLVIGEARAQSDETRGQYKMAQNLIASPETTSLTLMIEYLWTIQAT